MSELKKGIIKKIDACNRIVFPKDYKKMLDLEIGDDIELIVIEKGKERFIELRKVKKNDKTN